MRFQYQAVQRDGRLVSGLIEAPSERSAQRDLLRRGMQPTEIGLAATTGAGRATRRRTTVSRRDLGTMLKQLHALIAGGVPIADAVAALADATDHSGLAAAYGELIASLRRGDPFPRAFAAHFPAIPAHIQRMIEAGDFSGRLAEALADAAAELEHEAKIRGELRQSLVYPAFLLVFGCFAILFIFIVVVPRFAVMFQGKFDQLPTLSYVLIGAGMWFHDNLLLALALLALAGISAGYALGRPQSRAALVDLLARLPVLRGWSAEIEVARWAAVFARLLESRVPLIHSLELARTTLRRKDIQLRLTQAERSVRGGAALASALDAAAFLAPTALSLIRVGERSGNLPEMVRAIATIYEDSVRSRTRMALSIIEPTVIVVIGGIIGLVTMAIFLAISSINNVPGL